MNFQFDTLPFEPWVIITLIAAFLQNIRSSLQKHLKGVMGTAGATFVRFGFGVPVAFVLLALLIGGDMTVLPMLNIRFAIWVVVAALSQIIAQALAAEKIRAWTDGKTVVKTIYVPGKLVSVVVK